MTDTETGQTSPDTTLSTADAFALVGHEIRSEIIRVYGTLERDKPVIPFGEIRSRMTVDVEPSQLHYHLDQLVGHYIDRTENGYLIRPEGLRLLLTVKSGTFDREQEPMMLDPDFDCYTCQDPVKARLDAKGITIWCGECDTVYGYDFLTMPIEAFGDEPETFSFSHYSKYIMQKSMSIARGVCPNCAHPLQAEFRSKENLPFDRKVVIDYSCALCKANWGVWAGQALLADPGLRSFCADHGIDLFSTPHWELEFAATDEFVTVRSTDPWEVALEVTFDDETLELVVDGDLNVIERTHLNPSQNEELVLPDNETCLETLRRQRWPDGVVCPYCDNAEVIKKGMSKKNAQRYQCQACNKIFNDLTGTMFSERRLSLQEMVYIIREMDDMTPAQIADRLDRSHGPVSDLIDKAQHRGDEDFELDITGPLDGEEDS